MKPGPVQTINTEPKYGHFPSVRINVRNHVPHWKVYGDRCTASVEFNLCVREGNVWLSMDTEERAEKSSKRTMLTLNEASTRALYALLHAHLKASEADTPSETVASMAKLDSEDGAHEDLPSDPAAYTDEPTP